MVAADKEKGGPGSAVTRPIPSPEALDGFLEVLGDAEGDLLRRLDLDRLAGRRVAAHARRTVAHLKDAEARDADLVALLEVPHDQADELVEGAGGVLLGHARLLGQLGCNLGERDGRSGGFGSHSEGSLAFYRFANVRLTPQTAATAPKVIHESRPRKPSMHEKCRFLGLFRPFGAPSTGCR